MAQDRDSSGEVLVQVCLECGKEYTFEEEPPADLVCEKCGNGVFRSFHDSDRKSDAAKDFDDTTERDLHTDDAEGETSPSDLMDLNNL